MRTPRRFKFGTLLIAITGLAILGTIAYVAGLFPLSRHAGFVLLRVRPSPSGNAIAFVEEHPHVYVDQRLVGSPDRLRLLTVSNGVRDLGVVDFNGSIAWANNDSLLAYLSGENSRNGFRKQLCLYDLSQGTSETVFVGEDVRSSVSYPVVGASVIGLLQFSPDGKLLGFVDGMDLTLFDVDERKATLFESRVDKYDWRWSRDGKSIFYHTVGQELYRRDVGERSERVLLFEGLDPEVRYPHYNIVTSPDGRQIGLYVDGAFHALDLATHQVEKWFDCRLQFWHDGAADVGTRNAYRPFDWGKGGICYLEEPTKGTVRVMVYDPATKAKQEVAIGIFHHVSWLRDGVLLVLKNGTELWELSVGDKGSKRLFP